METSTEKDEFDVEKELEGKYVKYYYNNEVIGGIVRNISTVCLILSGNDVLARGIAICSMRDQYRKLDGRSISLCRAVEALRSKIDNDPIKTLSDRFTCTKKSMKHSIDCIDFLYPLFRTREQYGIFKSSFKPILTYKENKILKK